MKQRVPFYYNEFGCITSKCKDNCCIGGWEMMKPMSVIII